MNKPKKPVQKLNIPREKGYLHTPDGDNLWKRAEDGPTGIKPKFSAWPGMKGSK